MRLRVWWIGVLALALLFAGCTNILAPSGTATVSGIVLLNGEEPDDIEVIIEAENTRFSTVAKPNGAFSLELPAPGIYTLITRGEGVTKTSVDVKVKKGDKLTGIEIDTVHVPFIPTPDVDFVDFAKWQLWYDNPPNRQEMFLSQLADQGKVRYGDHVEFGWTNDGALYITSQDKSKDLGLKMSGEIPFPAGDIELLVTALVDIDLAGDLPYATVYFFDASHNFLGQSGNLTLNSSKDDGFVQYKLDLDPPAGVGLYRVGIFMNRAEGAITLTEITAAAK